jgi:hypothetical protein
MPRRLAKPAEPPPLHSLLRVTWLDAAFDLDSEPSLLLMETVGYLIRHTPESILIAGESSQQRNYFRSYTIIPTGMLQSIELLAPAA